MKLWVEHFSSHWAHVASQACRLTVQVTANDSKLVCSLFCVTTQYFHSPTRLDCCRALCAGLRPTTDGETTDFSWGQKTVSTFSLTSLALSWL